MFILNLRARGRFGHSVDESICNEGGFFSSGQIEMSSQSEIDGPPLDAQTRCSNEPCAV